MASSDERDREKSKRSHRDFNTCSRSRSPDDSRHKSKSTKDHDRRDRGRKRKRSRSNERYRSDSDSSRSRSRDKRKKSKHKKSKHRSKRRSRSRSLSTSSYSSSYSYSTDSDSDYYSSSTISSGSDSPRSRKKRKHKKSKSHKKDKKSRDKKSKSKSRRKDKKSRSKKDRKSKKERKEKKERKRRKKERKERKLKAQRLLEGNVNGVITPNDYRQGAHGFITANDLIHKMPEFTSWLIEVHGVAVDNLVKRDERKWFAKFCDDWNTSTMPDPKYYDLDKWNRNNGGGDVAMVHDQFSYGLSDEHKLMMEKRAAREQERDRRDSARIHVMKRHLSDLKRSDAKKFEHITDQHMPRKETFESLAAKRRAKKIEDETKRLGKYGRGAVMD